jgi:hypothetical protein
MERIDFFGSAVFVPIFLVSVGFLLKPSVMVEPETLKLAALFIAAAVGGKAVASFICKGALKLSPKETVLMLGITLPQAAATLAATAIGFDIGLFDQSVVNAVLVLILVSIIVATLIVERVMTDVPVPEAAAQDLGKRVLVALEDAGQARIGFAIGARVAAPDSGIVRGLLGSAPPDKRARDAALAQLRRVGYMIGVDTDPRLVHGSFAEGIVNAVAEHEPSFVLVGQHGASVAPALGGPGEAVAASIASPVAIVVGETEKIREVVLLDGQQPADGQAYGAAKIAAELAMRIGGKNVKVRPPGDPDDFSTLAPGQLAIAPTASWQALAAADPPPGAAVLMVLHPSQAHVDDDHPALLIRDAQI